MIVYQIVNTVNDKRYIGMTSQTLAARWTYHKYEARKGGKRVICAAIRKYGEQAFSIQPIASLMPGLSRKDLGDLEIALIAQEQTGVPNGYNRTVGGEGVHLIGPNLKKGKPLSDNQRAKLREAWARNPDRREELASRYRGKKLTAEIRKKISQDNRRPERLEALRERNRVMNANPEHGRKIAEGHARRRAFMAPIKEVCAMIRKEEDRLRKKAICSNPEWRANHSKRMAQWWADRKQGVA